MCVNVCVCVCVCLLSCVHVYVGCSGADRLVIALVGAHELQHSLCVYVFVYCCVCMRMWAAAVQTGLSLRLYERMNCSTACMCVRVSSLLCLCMRMYMCMWAAAMHTSLALRFCRSTYKCRHGLSV